MSPSQSLSAARAFRLVWVQCSRADSVWSKQIRTRTLDKISWDYNFEPAGSSPLSFTVKSVALKKAIDDFEWPGSSIQITLEPVPPSVTFRVEGFGGGSNTASFFFFFYCRIRMSRRSWGMINSITFRCSMTVTRLAQSRYRHYISMPNFSLNVETTLVLLLTQDQFCLIP